MIVKYFHYHVGSYVSKNTRGGDTIRVLIKLIVMGKYRESGEEVSVNTDRCPEKLGPNTYRRP